MHSLQKENTNFRILIVDDYWENRYFLRTILEEFFFELREAENGSEALEIWESWQPHFIWMDIHMPIMNGYKATKIIREVDRERKIIIVAISAHACNDSRQKFLEMGFDDFILKPCSILDIHNCIYRHLPIENVNR